MHGKGLVLKKMMDNMSKRHGSSTVLVLVVISVLIILGTALGANIIQWFSTVRGEETAVYAFIGAQSAVERSFNEIDYYLKPGNLVVNYNGNIGLYGDAIINGLQGKVTSHSAIQVFETSAPAVDVDIKFKRGDVNSTGTDLIIPITVTAKANLKNNGLFSSYGRTVAATMTFKYPIPGYLQLNGAIYTIGDIIATNSATVSISGSAIAFGTSPSSKGVVNQYYYGGIYAKKGSTVYINENAYSRSFIRTGEYGKVNGAGDPAYDGSQIYVKRDAIAQSIQIFGNQNAILVGRNAYTFDDLEVDGENSIIGINGSFFGLSPGDTANHDSSSAIVNTAPIHGQYSDNSKKSRIVINHDVFINGTTFKVDTESTTPTALLQLEEASVAWNPDSDEDQPAYRAFNYNPSATLAQNNADYLQYLRDRRTSLSGFLNIIQMWKPKTIDDVGDGWKVTLNQWLGDINGVINGDPADPGPNDWQYAHDLRSGVTTGTGIDMVADISKVTGFVNNVIAANDKMYFKEFSDINKLDTSDPLVSNYDIDRLTLDDLTTETVTQAGISTYWKRTLSGEWSGSYQELIRERLKILEYGLAGLTQVFCNRDLFTYENYSPLDNVIKNTFATSSTTNNLFEHINTYLHDTSLSEYCKTPSAAAIYVLLDPNTDLSNETNILTALGASRPVDKYYLVVNNNPDETLYLDGKFNGIIFSKGCVKLGRGADVTGAILAAGRGYDPNLSNNYVSDSAAGKYDSGGGVMVPRIPIIKADGSNFTNFENGDYAGVIFDGNRGTAGADIKVSFPGRTDLFDSFLGEDLDLSNIL